MSRLRFIFLLLVIVLPIYSWGVAAPTLQRAKLQGISIQADSMTRDTEHEVVELDGHVQIIFQTQHLKCQRAKINLRAKTVDAIGDVLVTSPQANIGGERVTLDYETGTGLIFEGYVQSGTVLFEGSLISKLSDVDYLADNAKYTACTTCPEAWSFSGKKIRAELGGYAYIKNSVMRFGSIPFLWLPYLMVPLKTDRQTGLLTPSISVEDPGGLIYSQGLFWAIDRSHDATITLKNYEQRGLKSLLEYNYVLDQNSAGWVNVGFLRDRVFANDSRLNLFRPQEQKGAPLNRWFFNYQHYYAMPDGYVQRALLNNVSDLQYPKDFDPEARGGLDSALENRASLTKNDLNQHFSIDSSYNINLLQSNPMAGNDDAVHRLPEIKYSRSFSRFGSTDLLYAFDLDYVNFARNGPGYDDLNSAYDKSITTNNRFKANTGNSVSGDPYQCNTKDWEKNPACREVRDGIYNVNKDLIRTGQRLDISPSFIYPLKPAASFDIVPKVNYRETRYNFGFGEESNITRRYFRFETTAKSIISATYGDKLNPTANRVKHEVLPELTYTAIPYMEQPQHPFFGTQTSSDLPLTRAQVANDAALNSQYGLQFDYNDRVYDRKLLTFALTNNLIEKSWMDSVPQYLQFFSWRLAQSYDMYQVERDSSTKQALSEVTSDMVITVPHFQLTNQAAYFPYQQITNTTTGFRVFNDDEDVAAIRYSSNIAIDPGKEANLSTRTQDLTLSVRKFSKIADLVATTIYDLNPNSIKKVKLLAYGVEFKIPGDCASLSITEKFENEKRTRSLFFNFIWDGQSKSSFIRNISGLYGI